MLKKIYNKFKLEVHKKTPRKVDIFIVGTQKCGTSALHSFLIKHKSIRAGKQKEIDFFNYPCNYNKGLDFYHSNFSLNFKEKCIQKPKLIDASPSYLTDMNPQITAQNIFNYNNKAQIIVLVRNPIDRAFSAYNMYKDWYYNGKRGLWFEWMKDRGVVYEKVLSRNEESFASFDNFVLQEINALKQNLKIECPILTHGKYFQNIELYNVVIKRILVIDNESLNRKTDKTLQKVTNFLKVSSFSNLSFENKKVFSGKYDTNISNEMKTILNEYYFESNKNLFENYGINYLE